MAAYEGENKKKYEDQRQLYTQQMANFWQREMESCQTIDFKKIKHHELPLARIKKIMKSDEAVKMISAEAPVLFSKACELFILDLTMRAWSCTDDGKRRTLQRSDVAEAITNSEMFDFLVDIVPREEASVAARATAATASASATQSASGTYPAAGYPAGQEPAGDGSSVGDKRGRGAAAAADGADGSTKRRRTGSGSKKVGSDGEEDDDDDDGDD